MTKLYFGAAIAALAATIPAAAPAQRLSPAVIAVVDIGRVSTECTACRAAATQLQTQGQQLQQRAQQLQQQLQTEGQPIQTAVNALNGKQPDAALQQRRDHRALAGAELREAEPFVQDVFRGRVLERAHGDARRDFEVGRLAGLPDSVLARARAMLALLEGEGERLVPSLAGKTRSAPRAADAQVVVVATAPPGVGRPGGQARTAPLLLSSSSRQRPLSSSRVRSSQRSSSNSGE